MIKTRLLWFLGVFFSLCSLMIISTYFLSSAKAQTSPALDSVAKDMWVTISSEYDGYSFQVPADWYRKMGVTPDRWYFLSDPMVANDGSIHPINIPNGLIKIDFGVETVANLLPEPEVRSSVTDEMGQATRDDLIPLLPSGGTWMTVDSDVPTLLLRADEKALVDGQGEGFTKATSIYILGEQIIYYFWIGYVPPDNGDTALTDEYDKIIENLLGSFIVDPKPPAGWYPVK
jgi:hypothetical protein